MRQRGPDYGTRKFTVLAWGIAVRPRVSITNNREKIKIMTSHQYSVRQTDKAPEREHPDGINRTN